MQTQTCRQTECDVYCAVIYNSFIEPNNVTTDSYFLRYEFTEAMLDALGIKDYTGVIYELVNYRYFEDDMLGDWDSMIDGMINVSADAECSQTFLRP